MKKLLVGLLFITNISIAQQKALVNTSSSKYAMLHGVNMGDVQWTNGFWSERFAVCRDAMVPQLWQTYTSKEMCYSFQNFRVAAGLDSGRFRGPSFHDGDFYKTLEAVAALYAATKDKKLDAWMDDAIAVIAKAQKDDGYIYTKSIIEARASGQTKMFDDKLSFEAYNFGHLMTAACVHYRATGKTSLLEVAKKATDFLNRFYQTATPEQSRNAICPSHYMGIVEMYRVTGNPAYLQFAKKLIDIRGTVEGTDDNSDRAPFREMNKVVGHAVRANYLFAGVADVYAETGDKTLLATLDKMWDNVTNHKMYVTGGCGALYDGVSVDGTAYKPDTVQKIHQAYGRDYQLPNLSAHNETCANIGNVLWNWRMLQLTGDAKYADVAELSLYNSVLSGISLDGTKFFYTNPLASTADYPYTLRWMGGRSSYISKSNCCPPNTVRTIAEVQNYMYSVGDSALYITMFGGNNLSTKLKDGSSLSLQQQTDYPWNGNVRLTIRSAPTKPYSIYLRMPGWCKSAVLKVNGTLVTTSHASSSFVQVKRKWNAGDKIEWIMDMPVALLESNPLVEETRNQVAVKRGPLVYCLESADMAASQNIFDIVMPASAVLKPVSMNIGGNKITALEGEAAVLQNNEWKNSLYREINKKTKPVKIRLIPYYAWANRGQTDMTVWMPVKR